MFRRARLTTSIGDGESRAPRVSVGVVRRGLARFKESLSVVATALNARWRASVVPHRLRDESDARASFFSFRSSPRDGDVVERDGLVLDRRSRLRTTNR